VQRNYSTIIHIQLFAVHTKTRFQSEEDFAVKSQNRAAIASWLERNYET
jgi:hypothetical protein